MGAAPLTADRYPLTACRYPPLGIKSTDYTDSTDFRQESEDLAWIPDFGFVSDFELSA